MTAGTTDGETDYRQEVRRLFRPALLTLALIALGTVALAASLFWTARQTNAQINAAPAHSYVHSSSLRSSAALLIPAVLAPALLVLLAVAGYRVRAAARKLGEDFTHQAVISSACAPSKTGVAMNMSSIFAAQPRCVSMI